MIVCHDPENKMCMAGGHCAVTFKVDALIVWSADPVHSCASVLGGSMPGLCCWSTGPVRFGVKYMPLILCKLQMLAILMQALD